MPFFTKSSFEVARLIFAYPNKTFHLRGLAKETNLSTTAVKKVVFMLNLAKIVKIEQTELTTNIKADLESEDYRAHKRIFNLYCLEKYQITKKIQEGYRAETVVLFGSFARGEDIEASDIDIAVILPSKDGAESLLDIPQKAINRKINIHHLVSLEKISKEFKNTLANGIVLYGYLKVV